MVKRRSRIVRRWFAGLLRSVLWWDVVLPKLGLGAVARRTRARRMQSAARSFRALAIELGGVLIKVGQFLSARLDVLPREITAELAGLQDEVGAEPAQAIREVLVAELGKPVESAYAMFDPVPVAAASIGQAHRARLHDTGATVIVKVQRPGIEGIVEADLAAIRKAARWMMRSRTVRAHADVPALVEEFARSLAEEIDYLREASNAERFALAFRDRPEVRVPAVIRSHTTRRVLTLEDVTAIKITDTAAIEAAGIRASAVAQRLMSVYLKQVFEDGFFHADPHPGNLFVEPKGGDFRLVFVDFGMTGTLEAGTFAALKEMLLAVGTRDAARVVRAFQALGVLLPSADLKLIERATQKVLERVWGRTTQEMLALKPEEFAGLAREFEDLLYEMPFQAPENLILLGRCLGILSGLATGLDPSFNAWATLTPYVTRLVRADGRTPLGTLVREAGSFLRQLVSLPRRADEVLAKVDEGRLDVRLPELRTFVWRLERGFRKLALSVVVGALLVSATILYVTGHTPAAVVAAAVDLPLALWLVLGR